MPSAPEKTTTTDSTSKSRNKTNSFSSGSTSFANDGYSQRDMYAPTQHILDQLINRVGSRDESAFGSVAGANTQAAEQGLVNAANQGSAVLPSAQQLQGNAGGLSDAGFGELQKTVNGDYLQGNPYFSDMLSQNLEDVQNRVNQQFSASGRYGSGAHTGVLADSIGDLTTQAMFQNYETERARQHDVASKAGIYGQAATGAGQQVDQAGIWDDSLRGQVGLAQDARAAQDQQAGLQLDNYQSGLLMPYASNFGRVNTGQSGETEQEQKARSTGVTNTKSHSEQVQEQERDWLGMGLGAATAGLGMMTGNPMGALGGLTNMAGAPTTGWGATTQPTAYGATQGASGGYSPGASGWGAFANYSPFSGVTF